MRIPKSVVVGIIVLGLLITAFFIFWTPAKTVSLSIVDWTRVDILPPGALLLSFSGSGRSSGADYSFSTAEGRLYYQQGNEVWGIETYLVPGIDPQQARHANAGGAFFRDDKHIYYIRSGDYRGRNIIRLNGVDPKTFDTVGRNIFKDAKGVYGYYFPSAGNPKESEGDRLTGLSINIIEGADPKEFKAYNACPNGAAQCGLYTDFYTDGQRVYQGTKPMPTLKPATLRTVWKGSTLLLDDKTSLYLVGGDESGTFGLYPTYINPDKLVLFSDSYQSDGTQVFFVSASPSGILVLQKLPDANPQDFRFYGCSSEIGGGNRLAISGSAVYRGAERVSEPSSELRSIGNVWTGSESGASVSIDKGKIFLGCDPAQVFQGLDPATTEVIGNQFVKDANKVYDRHLKLMEGIDPKSCTEQTLSKCSPTGAVSE